MNSSRNQRFRRAFDYAKSESRITQKDLAAKLGYKNQSYISDVYNGRSVPSLSLLSGFAELFPSISKQWLLTGEGAMLVGEDNNTTPPATTAVTQTATGNHNVQSINFTQQELIHQIQELKSQNKKLIDIIDQITKGL